MDTLSYYGAATGSPPGTAGSINRRAEIPQRNDSPSPTPTESTSLMGGSASGGGAKDPQRPTRRASAVFKNVASRTCVHTVKYSCAYFVLNICVLATATACIAWLLVAALQTPAATAALWTNPLFIALEVVVVAAVCLDVVLEMLVQRCRLFWCRCVPRDGDTPLFCCGSQGWFWRTYFNYLEVVLAVGCFLLLGLYLGRPAMDAESTLDDSVALSLLVVRYIVYVAIICRGWSAAIARQGGCARCVRDSLHSWCGGACCPQEKDASWDVGGDAESAGGGAGGAGGHATDGYQSGVDITEGAEHYGEATSTATL